MDFGQETSDLDQLFEAVAESFSVLSAPMRLRIISRLCYGEKTVKQLLSEITTSQPNISQHLGMLHRAGFIQKRRAGNLIYYAIADQRVVQVCQLMCANGKTKSLPAVNR
ncbi:metalloregulator ArsR/SmtB family transcription factor [Limnohabitans sp.]|uniref:ArsR/SmtB family transcription factor n=1 Tax=Limnohabitans sp. TaxID=1907725 RepID=UPI00311D88A2